MPSHSETRHLPDFTPEQLFLMVGDVVRYPEFLPWCAAARILEGNTNPLDGEQMLAELVISFKVLRESYVSNVDFQLPEGKKAPYIVDVSLVRGPFKQLTNHWEFYAHPEGGADLRFHVDFQFKSALLESMVGGLFDKAVHKMVGAFEERAYALYA